MFEAQILTGLWWVLWQTLQPYFPQKVSASGIPAYPGSPSQCTQSLFLKIRSVFWENRDFICSGRRKAGYSGLADLGVWTLCGLCSLNSFLNNGAQDIESPVQNFSLEIYYPLCFAILLTSSNLSLFSFTCTHTVLSVLPSIPRFLVTNKRFSTLQNILRPLYLENIPPLMKIPFPAKVKKKDLGA